jgi:hypothetical protein
MSGNLKNLLSNYDEKIVDVYVAYIGTLKNDKDKDGKLIAWWSVKITDEQFADIFKKVAVTGLYIDGDSITLTFRKKLIPTFDYHAYMNKVILSYPKTIFDFQIVYEGDKFSFKKQSGKVIYTHEIVDPFNTQKKIKGGYGVIKNKKGEFIEFLTMDDITKMKNTSTMKTIWDTWFDRMVLKSIIKRICNIHFKDIVKEIEIIDNETNDLDRTNIPEDIQKQIDNAKVETDLTDIYNANVGDIEDVEAFVNLLAKRKKEILNG